MVLLRDLEPRTSCVKRGDPTKRNLGDLTPSQGEKENLYIIRDGIPNDQRDTRGGKEKRGRALHGGDNGFVRRGSC